MVAVFFRIYLPLITPSLIAIGTYAFFYAWNEYLYAVLLLQGEKTITLPVGMPRSVRPAITTVRRY